MLFHACTNRWTAWTATTLLIMIVALGGISRRMFVAATAHPCGHELCHRQGRPGVRSLVPNPAGVEQKRDCSRLLVGAAWPVVLSRDGSSDRTRWAERVVCSPGDGPSFSLQAWAIRLQV